MQHVKTMLACMAATVLISCSKKDDEKKPDPKPSVSKAAGSWKTIAKMADRPVYHWNTIELVTDLWDREKECNRDDLLILDADGTGREDEGATKCETSDPQIIAPHIWKEEGSKLLITTEDGELYNYTIDRLDDSLMVLTGETWYGINGERFYYNTTTTFRRQ